MCQWAIPFGTVKFAAYCSRDYGVIVMDAVPHVVVAVIVVTVKRVIQTVMTQVFTTVLVFKPI